jgi:DNA-directed RNA polymerase subunit RPC12/RpoP
MKWIKSKDWEDSREMKCACGSRLFRIVHEPVVRQVKTMTAHHKRVAAVCPICNAEQRITRGGPN